MRLRGIFKVISVNILVFFALLTGVYWSFPIVRWLTVAITGEGVGALTAASDPRGSLPNYQGADWAPLHFAELWASGVKYKSFVGWRRNAYQGQTITVEGPYGQRRTENPPSGEVPKVYFFGGSTIWGTGSRDEDTIPSQFARITGFHAENFGETAYTAHQSLVRLIQLLQDGHRPDIVIFYDGVNEVLSKCRIELNPESHDREGKINAALEKMRPGAPISLSHYLEPIVYVASHFSQWLPIQTNDTGYDCGNNSIKSKKIGENLLRDWQMAKLLVEAYGGKFISILQPVIYFSGSRTDHLGKSGRFLLLEREYNAVYPYILKNIGESINLTKALDANEYFFIDFCHLSPNGNERIAQEMAQLVLAVL
ncbi:MAG: SGNH/GDSL hydrolase family protein [Alphaproteobacteria bacterium]